MSEPSIIYAGDSLSFDVDYSSSVSSSISSLSYALRGSGLPPIDLTATSSASGGHSLSVSAAITAGWTTGSYTWHARATCADGTVSTVNTGTVEVMPSMSIESDYDGRSFAKKMIDAIEIVMSGRATNDINQYSIGGRSITKMTPEELIKWRQHFLIEYQREQIQERARLGLGNGNRILTRFVAS